MSELITIQKVKDGYEVRVGEDDRVYVYPTEASALRKVKDSLEVEVKGAK